MSSPHKPQLWKKKTSIESRFTVLDTGATKYIQYIHIDQPKKTQIDQTALKIFTVQAIQYYKNKKSCEICTSRLAAESS